MKRFIYLIFLCYFVGCSQGTLITGTVRYEDGTPITHGNVVFDSAKESFVGEITSDGKYATGRLKQNQGIPDGVYTVWLSSTEEREAFSVGPAIDYRVTELVAPEYRSPASSPLRFEVKRGGERTFDIVVKRN